MIYTKPIWLMTPSTSQPRRPFVTDLLCRQPNLGKEAKPTSVKNIWTKIKMHKQLEDASKSSDREQSASPRAGCSFSFQLNKSQPSCWERAGGADRAAGATHGSLRRSRRSHHGQNPVASELCVRCASISVRLLLALEVMENQVTTHPHLGGQKWKREDFQIVCQAGKQQTDTILTFVCAPPVFHQPLRASITLAPLKGYRHFDEWNSFIFLES